MSTVTTASARAAELHGDDLDQRVHLSGACWQDYERLLAIRGDHSVPRITYLHGELELMSPSTRHEVVASMIARLLEAYAVARRLRLQAFGTKTWKEREGQRGAEADKCYVLGLEPKPRPDLAIEVAVTSPRGGLDKLDVYRGLGVPEVWVWRDGCFMVHLLRDARYEAGARSALLPELDLVLLSRLVERRDQTRTVRLFLRLLRRAR